MTNADGQMRDVVSPQCVSNAAALPALNEIRNQKFFCIAQQGATQLLYNVRHGSVRGSCIVALLFGDCPEINRQRAVDSNPSSYRIGSK